MTKTSQPTKPPKEAFEFVSQADHNLTFAKKSDDGKRGFELKLYDGGITPHWYWGNLAFDLKGMQLAKKSIPILYGHDTEKRIGVGREATFDGAFILSGYALDNVAAAEVQNDADQGFPFESSLKFDPTKSQYRFIRDGETATVNGRTLRGPGTIFTKTVIMEGSILVFGHMQNTKALAFGENNEHLTERKRTMNVQELKRDYPDLYTQVFEEGRAQGTTEKTQQFADIKAACGDDAALTVQAFEKNADKATALQMRVDKQTSELKARDEQIAALQKSKPVKADTNKQTPPDPAHQEFSDEAAKLAEKNKEKQAEKDTTAFNEDIRSLTEKSDDELKTLFEARKDLQSEFGKLESFIALIHGVRDGKVRM